MTRGRTAASCTRCFGAIWKGDAEMIAPLIWLVAAPPILALSVFVAEMLLGTARARRRSFPATMPSTVLLIPAHNEAATIGATLQQLEPLLSDRISLLVVADNCTDETAQIARAAGHRVVERADETQRGKGYALSFGRDCLKSDPPGCVIVFDADCETDAESIADLARACIGANSVMQARYVLHSDKAASPKVQISNFAFWVKNVVRQRGLKRLGGGAVLVGTGMAFPWKIFKDMPLATANIVEDLALGIHLTQAGRAPAYLEQALVSSAAASESATLGQRTRWEHGFLGMAKSHALPALGQGIARGNRTLFQLGLHLLVPPLAFLILCSLAVLVLLGGLALLTGYWLPAITLALCVAAAAAMVILNWAIEGHRWLSFGAMLRLPFYFIWKIPVYLRFAKGDVAGWTRTERPTNRAEP
ncbi:MAG: glycosyltransferase family 2 protein [Sphingomonadales bacterium]|nr:glycosyltransferase family 2 protein [Sphingomonadales bacterium]